MIYEDKWDRLVVEINRELDGLENHLEAGHNAFWFGSMSMITRFLEIMKEIEDFKQND